jgi:OTU-like cysteine protease
LKEIEEAAPDELKDYFTLTNRLDQEFASLKKFAGIFEQASHEAHRLVQSMMKAIEDKKTSLDKEMCAKVKKNFKPNPKTPADGSCLFWSIDDQAKTNLGARHYRKVAAEYIRNHPQDFEAGVYDVMNLAGEPKRKFDQYTRIQGGKDAWTKKLQKKLNRPPTEIDFYTDCLQNFPLWGGGNELQALSEELKATILVFTRENAVSWRIDLMAGQSKYPDKIYKIYYNGSVHYQSLIKQ